MSLHRIQLRGPWELELGSGVTAPVQKTALQKTSAQATPAQKTTVQKISVRKIRLPADWNDLFDACSGRVCLTRKFHRPTNLGPKEEVDLVFEQWPGVWAISLNHRPIAEFRDSSAESPERIAITALLLPTNVLSAETQIAQPAGQKTRRGPMGVIALEIRGD